MASIIDSTEEVVGNPTRALETAAELIQGGTTKPDASKKEERYQIPDKFVGKSLEEVLTAYLNLEALQGRTANELGQSRQSVDQLLQQKRENDLRASGATVTREAPKAPDLTAADLLENPTQALNSYLEHRESATTKELRERLAMQEAQLQQQQFTTRHPNWQQETNDPEFVNWARQTSFRKELASRAAQEDLRAADALLTEYKSYKPLLTRSSSQSTNLEAARKVGLERSASSGDETKPAGKILRRADAMALRIADPEKYDSPAFQNELLKAIAEDRYK